MTDEFGQLPLSTTYLEENFNWDNLKNVDSGIDASKAAVPGIGDVYIATDTHKIYMCRTAGTWEELSFGNESPADFLIYKDGSDAVALNGNTGAVLSRSATHSTVINAAIQALPTTGGHIFIKNGRYTLSSSILIDRPVHLEE